MATLTHTALQLQAPFGGVNRNTFSMTNADTVVITVQQTSNLTHTGVMGATVDNGGVQPSSRPGIASNVFTTFTYTPPTGFTGTATVVFATPSNFGFSYVGGTVITVSAPSNTAPSAVLNSLPALTVGTASTVTGTLTDTQGGTLLWRVVRKTGSPGQGDASLTYDNLGSFTSLQTGSRNGSGSISTTITPTITNFSTYYLLVKDSGGLYGRSIARTASATVAAITPTVTISGVTSTREDTNRTFTRAGNNIASTAWSISGSGAIVGSTTGSSVVVDPSDVGSNSSYTLTCVVTSSTSNTASDTHAVTVTPVFIPTITINGVTSTREDTNRTHTSTTSNRSSQSWSISGSGTISGSTTGTSVLVVPSNVGSNSTYTLSSTVTSSSGDTASDTHVVTVTPVFIPTVTITGVTTTDENTNRTFARTGSNISAQSWSVSGNGATSGSTTGTTYTVDPSSVGTAGGSYTVSITVTSSSGDTASDTHVVSVTDVGSGAGSNISGTASVRSDAANQVHTLITPPSNVTDYLWTLAGTAATITNGADTVSVTVNIQSAGTYTMTCRAFTSGGLTTYTRTFTVTAPVLPTGTVSGVSPIREDTTQTHTVTGTNINSIVWSISGVGTIPSGSTGTSVVVTPTNVGSNQTYQLTATITSTTGDRAFPSRTVTVTPVFIPAPVIAGATQTREDTNRNYTVSGANISTRVWSTSAGSLSSTSAATTTLTPPNVSVNTNVTLTCVATSSSGDSRTDTHVVLVTPVFIPTSVISGVTQTREDTGRSYTVSGNNISSRSWSTSAGSLSSTTAATTTFTPPNVSVNTNVTLTCTVTSSSGDTASDTHVVLVTPVFIPTATIGGVTTTREDTNRSHSVTGNNINTRAWSISGSGSISGSTTGSSVTVIPAQVGTGNGTYTLSVTVTSTSGDTAGDTHAVTVTNVLIPTATIGGVTTTREDTNRSHTVTGNNINVRAWSISGNGSISGSTTGATVTVVPADVGANGSYTLSVTVTSTSGDTASDTHAVTVTPVFIPSVTITGATSVNEGVSTSFGTNRSNVSTLSWSISGNGTITGSTTGTTVTVAPGAVGPSDNSSFTLTVGVASSSGDTASDTHAVSIVFVNRAPTITTAALATPSTVLSGGNTAMTVTASDPDGQAVSYTWRLGSTVLSTAQNFTYTPATTTAAHRDDTLIVTASDGSLTVVSQEVVRVVKQSTVSLVTSDTTPNERGSSTFTATVSNGTGTTTTSNGYSWSTPGGVIQGSTNLNAITVLWNEVTTNTARTVSVTATTSRNNPSTSIGVTVQQVNRPPNITSVANANPSTVASGGSTNLTVNATDADTEQTLSYVWRFGSTVISNAEDFTWTPAANTGTANRVDTVTVTVSDSVTSVTSSEDITITPTTTVPVAVLTLTGGFAGSAITADGSLSTHPGGTLNQYAFTVTGPGISTSQTGASSSFVISTSSAGTYTFTLQVRDTTDSPANPSAIVTQSIVIVAAPTGNLVSAGGYGIEIYDASGNLVQRYDENFMRLGAAPTMAITNVGSNATIAFTGDTSRVLVVPVATSTSNDAITLATQPPVTVVNGSGSATVTWGSSSSEYTQLAVFLL